jgi:hypothetical protein
VADSVPIAVSKTLQQAASEAFAEAFAIATRSAKADKSLE